MKTFSLVNLLSIPAKRWNKQRRPKRILAIRLQAMGDLVITLPYLQSLRNSMPYETQLDLLTREEVDSIPRNIELFDHVYSLGGGRNWKKQLALVLLLVPRLLFRRYDVIIDLQNNIISKTVRKTLMPAAWAEFDRYSSVPAGECTRLTIDATGIGNCKIDSSFKFKTNYSEVFKLLKENGWENDNQLVLLNPAGAFETRNWPIEYYSEFAKIWLNKFPNTQFVMMGTDFIIDKSDYLKEKLGDKLINLVCKTTPAQAFALLQQIQLVISEDSGLMHMAWVSGVPTLAMFGSTRKDRATPLGRHTLLLHSSDLVCGNCMKEQCRYGDNHCMTRFSPQLVVDKAAFLMKSVKSEPDIKIVLQQKVV